MTPPFLYTDQVNTDGSLSDHVKHTTSQWSEEIGGIALLNIKDPRARTAQTEARYLLIANVIK